MRGSDHACLPLIVSRGANIEAPFDLSGVGASARGEPVRLREERRGLQGEECAVGPRGLPGGIMPDSDHATDLYRLSTT